MSAEDQVSENADYECQECDLVGTLTEINAHVTEIHKPLLGGPIHGWEPPTWDGHSLRCWGIGGHLFGYKFPHRDPDDQDADDQDPDDHGPGCDGPLNCVCAP